MQFTSPRIDQYLCKTPSNGCISCDRCWVVHGACTYITCLLASNTYAYLVISLVLAALDKLGVVLWTKKITVLVLDDVSSLFRGGETSTPELLYSITSALTELAGVYRFAVFVVNQVSVSFPASSFIRDSCGGGGFGDVPALGLNW
jgi:hypothetical protein